MIDSKTKMTNIVQ